MSSKNPCDLTRFAYRGKNKMTKYDVAIFLLAAAIIGLIIYNVQKSHARKQGLRANKAIAQKRAVSVKRKQKIQPVIEKKVEIIEKVVEVPKQIAKKSMWSDADESPNSAFPSMHADLGESELAQAYTYENLQDSMLTRETSVRANSSSENFDTIKKEIELSGQSLEQFVENSWAPIPEKLSQLWKETEEKEVKVQKKVVKPTRAALSEAASLSVDCTQAVNLKSEEETMKSLHDILSAKKRGKALGLTLPSLTNDQIAAFAKLESNKSYNGLIRTIKSF